MPAAAQVALSYFHATFSGFCAFLQRCRPPRCHSFVLTFLMNFLIVPMSWKTSCQLFFIPSRRVFPADHLLFSRSSITSVRLWYCESFLPGLPIFSLRSSIRISRFSFAALFFILSGLEYFTSPFLVCFLWDFLVFRQPLPNSVFSRQDYRFFAPFVPPANTPPHDTQRVSAKRLFFLSLPISRFPPLETELIAHWTRLSFPSVPHSANLGGPNLMVFG